MKVVFDGRVYGTPAPQGSKNQFGGESSRHVKPWRASIAQTVGEVVKDDPLLTGPVELKLEFVFARPKKHLRANGQLRDDAPLWHTSPGDLDKLCRAVLDALTSVAYVDDKQVCSLLASKVYGERAYARITIVDLSGGSNVTSGTDAVVQGANSSEDRS